MLQLTAAQKAEVLALITEKQARAARRRADPQRQRTLANSRTLAGFVREFWPVLEPVRLLAWGWALDAMCAHLEAVTRGDINRLILNVPPGSMKSLLVSVFWPAWEWGPQGFAHNQYLTSSFSQTNVVRDNVKMRRLVASEKYQALWPVTFQGDQNAKLKFENTATGFREGRPFESLTGGRGDRLLIDDPHSVDGGESDTQRDAAVRTFFEAGTDRLNSEASAIVVIMQRLHERDLTGELLKRDLGYVHLELPMEFEPQRRCETFLFTDPRTQAGELLFPELFSANRVADLKKAKGSYAWAGQYQQRPAPRDGGLFKVSDFKLLKAMPAGHLTTCRAWDIGATEGGGDPTAGVRMHRVQPPSGAALYVIDNVKRGQLSPAGVQGLITSTAAADTSAVKIRLPQDPGSAGKAYVQTLVTALSGYPAVVERPTGDKVTRATALSVQVEAGNVYLLVTGDPAKDAWIEPFADEVGVFPAGAHDDQVDAAADAFNELALGPSAPTIQSLRM